MVVAARRERAVITECGHIRLPEVICVLPGDNRAWCETCGIWSPIVRPATPFDFLGVARPEYPDNPLF